MTDPRSDKELIDAWQSGDRAAGSTLLRRHFAVVYRFFRTKLDDQLDDLVQQTFAECFASLHRFDPERGNFRSFALGIANKVLLMTLRKRFRGDRALALEVAASDVTATLTRQFVARQEMASLVEALRRLPMELQIALELRYWERLTNVQIAEITEVPEGTVKSRINRAKRLLRTIISQLEAPPQIVRDTVERLDEWVEQVRERLLRDSEKRASSAGEDEPEGNDPSRS